MSSFPIVPDTLPPNMDDLPAPIEAVPLTKEDVHRAIFATGSFKAPGLDGLPGWFGKSSGRSCRTTCSIFSRRHLIKLSYQEHGEQPRSSRFAREVLAETTETRTPTDLFRCCQH